MERNASSARQITLKSWPLPYRRRVPRMFQTRERNPNYKPVRGDSDRITQDLAYLVGVHLGDGYARERMIVLATADIEFAQAWGDAIKRQFGREVKIISRPGPTTFKRGRSKFYISKISHRVRLCSVTASDILRSVSNQHWIDRLPVELKLDMLRGLWDSEGCISPNGTGGRSWSVRFSNSDLTVISIYQNLLKECLGIQPGISWDTRNWVADVRFSRLEDVILFHAAVKPTIQRKRERFQEAIRCFGMG